MARRFLKATVHLLRDEPAGLRELADEADVSDSAFLRSLRREAAKAAFSPEVR